MTDYGQRLGPLPAALLNSTFIQAFELDDYHSGAPIHSAAVILPSILAAAQQISRHGQSTVPGSALLLAAIVGFEVGPRVGLGLHGIDMLTRGWHSGAVFGPTAAAAATSNLMHLSADVVEDALGIACTQAGGLMAAQYGSMVKRMQHGFAARNGLFATLMASKGYTGIKGVLEQPYGGYLSTFGLGSKHEPTSVPERIISRLGQEWEIMNIVCKSYASVATTHAAIDCVILLQDQHPDELRNLENISNIQVEMSETFYKKSGWTPLPPISETAAQMSVHYAVAMQLVERHVHPEHFSSAYLESPEVWKLIGKCTCRHNRDFDKDEAKRWYQRVTIDFSNGAHSIQALVKLPKGIDPKLSDEEILQKWRRMAGKVIAKDRVDEIEKLVLDLENVESVETLTNLIMG